MYDAFEFDASEFDGCGDESSDVNALEVFEFGFDFDGEEEDMAYGDRMDEIEMMDISMSIITAHAGEVERDLIEAYRDGDRAEVERLGGILEDLRAELDTVKAARAEEAYWLNLLSGPVPTEAA